ncbi:cysteine hydrolase family protein [Endozoicomonas numazuensis]|uniref:Isochorismatase n=1 Tax=Endozoicomonas numazuensis TaxID=1137799 RepID=A0A081N9I6_9GAMM|nr:cysteine hydrolase family protein [Endozoicomonas numazuensis]KEQ15109.1 Isochorismatase [Endozoicomonas numazuensis]
MNKRALVIIDLQNDYYPGGLWSLYNIEQASKNARSVLESVRNSGDLVIHVRHEFEDNNAPFFLPDSEGAAIHADVMPLDNEPVVLKHAVNAFHQTNLKALLDEHDIKELVLVGAMSHICIDAATRAAADYGYKVTLIEDACASKDVEFDGKSVKAEDVHTAFMSALSFGYADVVSTREWLEQ